MDAPKCFLCFIEVESVGMCSDCRLDADTVRGLTPQDEFLIIAEGEVGQPIEDYPGYIITSLGRVLNAGSMTEVEYTYSRSGSGRPIRKLARIHSRARLRRVSVAFLAGMYFIPDYRSDWMIRFHDGDPLNARSSNLYQKAPIRPEPRTRKKRKR